ncbi:MAG: nucleoside phosphorylase [Anaerolineaceae bacterium]|nr:nucleoside phosphorylase [Anaerolineaceae bacterium]
MAKQYHIQLDVGDCAPFVLLPGDPGRVKMVAETWDSALKVAENREYVTYTGEYKGVPITCTSTGIGASSTAIAVEELARVGAKTFLRIGTCGTFQDRVKNGDMIIFDSAARYDGASRAYAPIEFPAVAHYTVIQACIQAAKKLGIPFHVGTTRTHDGLYARQPAPGGSFNDYWQSGWAHHYDDLRRLNVIASEMEASVIFVLAKIWGLRAGGIATSVINVLNSNTDKDEYDPEKDFDHSVENIKNLSRMGSEAIYILAQMDKESKLLSLGE